MNYTLLGVALIVAILDWVAVSQKIKLLEYFVKPAVMLVLLLWLWQASAYQGTLAWFALGLAFSLTGDIFLMLPREQFIPGLIAFLFAHIAYLVGLNPTEPPFNTVALILAVLVGLTALQIFRAIARGLVSSGQQKLIQPVFAYSSVISLMLLSALLTLVRPEWQAGPALLVSFGALLFFFSDTILAWNKFITPLRHGRLVTMTTYHVGQTLLVLGAVLHYAAYA